MLDQQEHRDALAGVGKGEAADKGGLMPKARSGRELTSVHVALIKLAEKKQRRGSTLQEMLPSVWFVAGFC